MIASTKKNYAEAKPEFYPFVCKSTLTTPADVVNDIGSSVFINIYDKFKASTNVNKKFIYAFDNTSTALTLTPSATISYTYGYTTISTGIETVVEVPLNGTAVVNPFSNTTTYKRWVIVHDTANAVCTLPLGSVWGYLGGINRTIGAATSVTTLKYIHYEKLNTITVLAYTAFNGCSGLTGNLYLNDYITAIPYAAFNVCTSLTGELRIPKNVNSCAVAFYNCNFTSISSYSPYFPVYDNTLYDISQANSVIALYSPKLIAGTFELRSDTTSIANYCFWSNTLRTGALTMPSGVTSIGGSAFSACTGMTSLSLNSGLLTITDNAFSGNTNITGSLVIPNSVTTIGSSAFNNCTKLTGTLTIGSSVTSIGALCFSGAKLTGALNIPSSVTAIGAGAFAKNEFSTITTSSDKFSVVDNILYDISTSGKVKALYSAKAYAGTITLRNDTTDILDYCFSNNTLRTGVLTIPNTVTLIGQYAFEYLTGITGGLTIPSSLTSIGIFAFRNSSFTSLNINEGISSISQFCFSGCYFMTGDLVIPNSVTTINDYAFYSCAGFNGSITLGTGLINMSGSNTFYNCVNIKKDLNFLTTKLTNTIALNLLTGIGSDAGSYGLKLPVGFANSFTYSGSNAISDADSVAILNQSIINCASGTKTITIGATNVANLVAAYPNAVTNAAARGITIN